MRKYTMALARSNQDGVAITAAGGAIIVVANGTSKKVALTNKDGGAIANPVPLVNGKLEFYTSDDVSIVDLYGVAPGGQSIVRRSVRASGPNEIFVNTTISNTVIVVPFDARDMVAATETDTGLDLPIGAVVVAGAVNIEVVTVEATRTISAGTLSTEASGSAAKYIATASVATAGTVMSTTLAASAPVAPATAQSISLTTSASTATAAGFVKLPVQLPVLSL